MVKEKICQHGEWTVYLRADESFSRLVINKGFGEYYVPISGKDVHKAPEDFIDLHHKNRNNGMAQAFHHALLLLKDPSVSPNAKNKCI